MLSSVCLSYAFCSLAGLKIYRINKKLLLICEVSLKAYVSEKDCVSRLYY